LFVALKPIERVKLFVRVRSQGARVESVPLKRLIELSKCGFHDWRFEKVGDVWCLELKAI
jgi:hypothetical protein